MAKSKSMPFSKIRIGDIIISDGFRWEKKRGSLLLTFQRDIRDVLRHEMHSEVITCDNHDYKYLVNDQDRHYVKDTLIFNPPFQKKRRVRCYT